MNKQRCSLALTFFVALIAVRAISAENVASNSLSLVEQFKQFLSSPKAAALVEATIREPIGVQSSRTNYELQGIARVQCCWTTNLFAYTEDFELPGKTRHRMDIVRDGDSFTARTIRSADQTALNGTTISWKSSSAGPAERDNPGFSDYFRARGKILTIMNLGIPEVEIGKARWNGERFRADAVSRSGIPGTYVGELLVDEAGAPSRLKLRRTSSRGILDSEIRYRSPYMEFKGGEAVSLPAQFSVYKFRDRIGTNAPDQEVAIESVQLVSPEEVRRKVDELTLLASKMTNQLVVQGRVLHERLPDGRLVPDQRLRRPLPVQISFSAGRRLYWLTSGLLGIGFLLFLGRGGLKH